MSSFTYWQKYKNFISRFGKTTRHPLHHVARCAEMVHYPVGTTFFFNLFSNRCTIVVKIKSLCLVCGELFRLSIWILCLWHIFYRSLSTSTNKMNSQMELLNWYRTAKPIPAVHLSHNCSKPSNNKLYFDRWLMNLLHVEFHSLKIPLIAETLYCLCLNLPKYPSVSLSVSNQIRSPDTFP